MFSSADTQDKTRLANILAKYGELCNRDSSALSSLLVSQQEVWRLFVDGCRQHQSWLPFEQEEPGYLKAMHSAYSLIFSKDKVTLDFIKSLHKTALTDVLNTKYKGRLSEIGEMRTQQRSNAVYGIFKENTTE